MNKILWLWLPFAFMAVQIVLELALSQRTLVWMHGEGGPHEAVQTLIVAAAFIAAAVTLFKMDKGADKLLTAWVALAALCCFYVTGEEISWGQHLLNWSTPEYWAAVNDQNETNLHNTSSWLDQKPRLLLEIGVLTGGLVIPLLRRFRPQLLPAQFAVIYPPACLALVALLALGVHVTDKIGAALDVTLFERGSEVEELYLYYFVLLYLLSLKQKILKK